MFIILLTLNYYPVTKTHISRKLKSLWYKKSPHHNNVFTCEKSQRLKSQFAKYVSGSQVTITAIKKFTYSC